MVRSVVSSYSSRARPRAIRGRPTLTSSLISASRVLTSPAAAAAVAAGVEYARRSIASNQSTRSSSRPSYATRRRRTKSKVRFGVRGSHGKRYGRERKQRTSSVYKTGVVVRDVDRGVTTQTAASHLPVIIGHSTFNFETFFRTFWYAVVRRLLNQTGMYPRTINDGLGPAGTSPGGAVRVRYRNREMVADAFFDVGITPDSTIRSIGLSCFNSWYSLYSDSTDGIANMTLVRIELYAEYANPAILAINLPMSKVELENAVVDIEVFAKLMLQNRTEATTVATEDNDNANSVEANPVAGKHYYCSMNGFSPKCQQVTVNNSFVAGRDTGLILPSLATLDATMQQAYGTPPPQSAFKRCKASAGFRQKPGEIRTSILSFKKTVTMNYLMDQLAVAIRTKFNYSTTMPIVHMFNSRMFYFNKVCDTGSEEPNLVIGYEHNTSYGVAIRPRRNMMMPHNTEFQ